MLQLTSDHGQQSSAAVVAINYEKLLEETLKRLSALYGDYMTSEQVSRELNYSENYFRKKIGNAQYQHLAWVKVINPARKKRADSGYMELLQSPLILGKEVEYAGFISISFGSVNFASSFS